MNDITAFQNQINELQKQLSLLQFKVNFLVKPDRYTFQKNIDIPGTGLKIGTTATQKLGFFGTTPAAQYVFHFNGVVSGSWGGTEQATLEGIRLALISYGLITS